MGFLSSDVGRYDTEKESRLDHLKVQRVKIRLSRDASRTGTNVPLGIYKGEQAQAEENS
jgi:hypothetical protein